MSRAALERFLESLAAAYKSNPYHNEHHASDVVQSLGMQLAAYAAERAAAGAEPMGEVEVLTAVLAAAAHDVAHPGVNNDFHQRAGTELAQEFGAAGRCARARRWHASTLGFLLLGCSGPRARPALPPPSACLVALTCLCPAQPSSVYP